MDKKLFVQNIKKYCALRGVKPTVACRESGVSSSFITNIEKGSEPSVAKVQKLATYLGVTVGELLGERPPEIPVFPEHPYLVLRYDKLSKEDQQDVMAYIEFKAAQAVKKEKQQNTKIPDTEE